jgi:hypothetical protein
MLNVTYKHYLLNVVLLSVLPGTNNVVFLSGASVTYKKNVFKQSAPGRLFWRRPRGGCPCRASVVSSAAFASPEFSASP